MLSFKEIRQQIYKNIKESHGHAVLGNFSFKCLENLYSGRWKGYHQDSSFTVLIGQNVFEVNIIMAIKLWFTLSWEKEEWNSPPSQHFVFLSIIFFFIVSCTVWCCYSLVDLQCLLIMVLIIVILVFNWHILFVLLWWTGYCCLPFIFWFSSWGRLISKSFTHSASITVVWVFCTSICQTWIHYKHDNCMLKY